MNDVVAVGPDDVWAVGSELAGADPDDDVRTLVAHWDGASWKTVQSWFWRPDKSFRLFAVAAVSKAELWAVGESVDKRLDPPYGATFPTVARWDATTATLRSLPNVLGAGVRGRLFDVAALGPDDVWVVGEHSYGESLIAHWDGTRWTSVPSATAGPVRSISAISPNDIWAAGGPHGALQHWDGTRWTSVPTGPRDGQSEFVDIAASAPGDVWAVGGEGPSWAPRSASKRVGASPLFGHWDGRDWNVVSSPLPSVGSDWNRNPLQGRLGVAVAGPGDAWAVGQNPLVSHWDGVAWGGVAVPHWDRWSPHEYAAQLRATAVTPTGDVWAVGRRHHHGDQRPHTVRLCPIRLSSTGFDSATATVELGSDVAWSLPATNAEPHTVSDASGMELFDSGPRPPGTSYTTRLIAAGTYPIRDHAGSNTSQISVPLQISPRRGSPTTTFGLTWASQQPPSGYVFDVQVKRPSDAAFSTWHNATTATEAGFTPDDGTGRYSFRSRLRKTSSDRASKWSTVTYVTAE